MEADGNFTKFSDVMIARGPRLLGRSDDEGYYSVNVGSLRYVPLRFYDKNNKIVPTIKVNKF